jgi:hypothetical protein
MRCLDQKDERRLHGNLQNRKYRFFLSFLLPPNVVPFATSPLLSSYSLSLSLYLYLCVPYSSTHKASCDRVSGKVDWLSEGVWANSHSPVEGEWPIVVRPLLSSKRRPYFITRGPNGTRSPEQLLWRGPAAIYWIGLESVCPPLVVLFSVCDVTWPEAAERRGRLGSGRGYRGFRLIGFLFCYTAALFPISHNFRACTTFIPLSCSHSHIASDRQRRSRHGVMWPFGKLSPTLLEPFHCRVHNGPPLVPILSQLNRAHSLTF